MLRATLLLLAALVGGCGAPATSPGPARASEAPATTAPPAPAPPAPAPPAPAPDPTRTCAADEDCVLVRNDCATPAGANRAHAAEAEAAADERLSRVRCAAPVAPHHWVPLCSGGACTVGEHEHPEWRGCSDDADCAAVEQGCRWTVIARAHEASLRAAYPLDAACPGILPVPPRVRCLYRSCVEAP